jgi:hypothetical protein
MYKTLPLAALLVSTGLVAENSISLKKGWNLVGTTSPISDISALRDKLYRQGVFV